MYFHIKLIWSHKCEYHWLEIWSSVSDFIWHVNHSCAFLSEGVHPEWTEGVHFKTKRINKSSLTPTTCIRCWWVVPWTRLGVITLGIPVIAQLWPTKMLLVFPWIHRKVAGYASRSELYYDYPLDRCYTYVLSIHRLHVDYSLGAIIFVYARVDQTLLYVANRL
jgi:hypothetical protein